jgi:hypothetical protein
MQAKDTGGDEAKKHSMCVRPASKHAAEWRKKSIVARKGHQLHSRTNNHSRSPIIYPREEHIDQNSLQVSAPSTCAFPREQGDLFLELGRTRCAT